MWIHKILIFISAPSFYHPPWWIPEWCMGIFKQRLKVFPYVNNFKIKQLRVLENVWPSFIVLRWGNPSQTVYKTVQKHDKRIKVCVVSYHWELPYKHVFQTWVTFRWTRKGMPNMVAHSCRPLNLDIVSSG